MLHIDKTNRDGKHYRFYFGNTSIYKEALKANNSDMRLTQMADTVIDVSSNKVLKCRYLLKEVFDSYYEQKSFQDKVIWE